MMKNKKEADEIKKRIDNKILKNSVIPCVVIVIVLIGIFAFLISYLPALDKAKYNLGNSVSRGGAIITLVGLWVEFFLLKIKFLIEKNKNIYKNTPLRSDLVKWFGKKNRLLAWSALGTLILMTIGTVIWAYGDVIVDNHAAIF